MLKTKNSNWIFIAAALVLVSCIANGAKAEEIARYNLGEDDGLGAIAGFPGADPTVDAVGSYDLAKTGDPIYSSNVPAGGSTLSMDFGTGDNFYNGSAPTTDFVNYDITIEFDANMTNPGAGFSFLASLGSNFGGIAVVEIGGTVGAFMPGVGGGDRVAPALGQWQHYMLSWDAIAEQLSLELDGNLVSTLNATPANNQIVDSFTIAANDKREDPVNEPPLFEGYYNGLLDNVVVSATLVPEPSSVALLGLSGIAFGFIRRRRR